MLECRAARLCHSVAHPGQLVMPLDLAEAFVAQCGGEPLAGLLGQTLPMLAMQSGGDRPPAQSPRPVHSGLHAARQDSAPVAAKQLAARLLRSSLGRAASSESTQDLLPAVSSASGESLLMLPGCSDLSEDI